MHKRLEQYLTEMEASLRALPAEERESDIAEMRQHIQSMVDACRELDLTEEQAIDCALKQFGPSRAVGHKLAIAATDRWQQVGRKIHVASWLLFVGSMFMPVIQMFGRTIAGYQCAAMVFASFPTGASLFGAFYYHCLGTANIMMLISPILTRRTTPVGFLWSVTAALLAAAIGIVPLTYQLGWSIGFYCWYASMISAAVGCGIYTIRRTTGKKRVAIAGC